MAKNHFLAGVGTALLFKGNELIGVAKTLTESTFDFAISAEDVRGGKGNGLLGRYFHDSSLTATLTDAMFDLNYMALSLGVPVEQGGISVKEEELTVGADGTLTVSETPVAFDGTMIGWYKKPTADDWTVGTLSGQKMTISGGAQNDVYCVKYFYMNENAKSITIKSQYVPSVLHVVVMTDLYSGKVGSQSDATRYGRLIVDIPQFQLEGNQNLALNATSAATISLTGMALAVLDGNTCEEDPYYGTMTEEINGAKWQDDVKALAVVGDDTMSTGDKQTLAVYAVFGGNTASQLKPNSNFTFTAKSGSSTVSSAGEITAAGSGDSVIEVKLTGSDVVASFVVTVA